MSEAEDAKSTAAEDIKGDNGPVSKITIGIVSVVLTSIINLLSLDSSFLEQLFDILIPVIGEDLMKLFDLGTVVIPGFIIYITLCRLVLKINIKETIPEGILVGIASVIFSFIVLIVYFFATFEIR